MTDAPLRQLLDTLHDRLGAARSLSAEDRTALEQLSSDIRAVLTRRGAAPPASVLTRIESAATQFEGSHPELAVTLMQVVKALGDMGI